MVFDWSIVSQAQNEVTVVDEAAEQTALKAFDGKARVFGLDLRNVRVSILEETEIVRIDLYDSKINKVVGIAIRVQSQDDVHELFDIFAK